MSNWPGKWHSKSQETEYESDDTDYVNDNGIRCLLGTVDSDTDETLFMEEIPPEMELRR